MCLLRRLLILASPQELFTLSYPCPLIRYISPSQNIVGPTYMPIEGFGGGLVLKGNDGFARQQMYKVHTLTLW